MSGSKCASGACHKSMWRTSAYHAASMSAVKTGETSAAPLAGAPRFTGARNCTIDEALERAAANLSRVGFPNRGCSDSTCWLGGGRQGWLQPIRRICATG
jgi:hypothetical protein